MQHEIIHGLSMDEYRASSAVSASDLKNLKRSPAYAHMRDSVSTPAQEWGTAVHTAILEPDELDTRYRLEPEQPADNTAKVWRATKLYKEALAVTLAEPGVEGVLSAQQFEDLAQIQRNVARDPVGEKMHATVGHNEASAFAFMKEAGLWVKVRPDRLMPEARMVVDVKTARQHLPGPFARACATYDYHLSAAMYLDVLSTFDPYDHYVFLVVASDAPFEVRSYTLDEDSIEQGRAEYQRGLIEWKHYREEGYWPGGTGQIEELRLPEYRIDYYEETAA